MEGTVKGLTYKDYVERLEFLDSFLNEIDNALKEGTELPTEMLEKSVERQKERNKVERIVRCWGSTLDFMYEYFSEDRNPDNAGNLIPQGINVLNAPHFHKELSSYLDDTVKEITKRLAWSVPRGHAKSTYLSNMFPLYNIVFNLRNYIIIVSETEAGAIMFTEWINLQLKHNEKLREDFGELMSTNTKENIRDNNQVFVTLNNIKVQSASIGKQLRGSRHLSHRPDLVIADDLESSRNTNTPDLREKNFHWFNSVVMPLGDPERTAFIYMGTLVHPLGLLPSVMERPDFEDTRYSAIISEPDNAELWNKYESIYSNQEDDDRKQNAENFYYENQIEMDKGTATLWADRFPYYKLMQEKVNVGSRAFNSEFLNIPFDIDNAIFKPEMFVHFDDKDLFDNTGRYLPLDLYGFWDVAITGTGDYNAIVTIGRDRRTGIFYVIDAWAKKCNMHEALAVAEQKILEYRHHTFGVETIQAQWSMYQQLKANLSKQGYFATRMKSVQPRTKKEMRIEALEPIVEQGAIRVKKSQRLLLEQLEQFPQHDHDDLPDALASCVDMAGNRRKRLFMNKPEGW
ncbi:phage terminase large subunit [Geomicrobium sp. JCM 19055]|uniref:phage terminase large subunit n=1 Tax=Geomicrobium sp. JCM 19055 TaxID=1460649 RepID=UPI00045EDA24|nr:phage terminase large subunit [Geomicrobium sp. JCM 19055]GAK00917.1 hypothetical protein JCM19055_4044 [Geomicrobium sp. JCM 19055]